MLSPHASVNNCNGKMRIFAEVLSGGTSLRCGRSISCEELWERMVYPPHRYLGKDMGFWASLFWKILRAGESNQWYPQVFLFEGLFRYIYYTIFRFTATNLKTFKTSDPLKVTKKNCRRNMRPAYTPQKPKKERCVRETRKAKKPQ